MIGYFQGIFFPYGFIHRILRHGGRTDPIFFFRIIRYPFNERLTFRMHQFVRGCWGTGYFTSVIDNLVIIGGLAIFQVVIISTGVSIGLQTCPVSAIGIKTYPENFDSARIRKAITGRNTRIAVLVFVHQFTQSRVIDSIIGKTTWLYVGQALVIRQDRYRFNNTVKSIVRSIPSRIASLFVAVGDRFRIGYAKDIFQGFSDNIITGF